jgi:hypothetical protein
VKHKMKKYGADCGVSGLTDLLPGPGTSHDLGSFG